MSRIGSAYNRLCIASPNLTEKESQRSFCDPLECFRNI